MEMFKWRNFTLVSFYILYLFTCYNVSATSTHIMSNIRQDDNDFLDICKIIYCGKGTCHPQTGLFNFSCDCDSGWKKFKIDSFEFPSCVLPNCTIDLQCGNGVLPTPPSQLPSLFDPCLLSLCGDGKCVRNGSTDFKCECNEGSANLLNDPRMICLNKCGLGGNCNGLDLGFHTSDAATPPPSPSSSSSPGTGSGERLKNSEELYMLTIMILAIISQNWI